MHFSDTDTHPCPPSTLLDLSTTVATVRQPRLAPHDLNRELDECRAGDDGPARASRTALRPVVGRSAYSHRVRSIPYSVRHARRRARPRTRRTDAVPSEDVIPQHVERGVERTESAWLSRASAASVCAVDDDAIVSAAELSAMGSGSALPRRATSPVVRSASPHTVMAPPFGLRRRRRENVVTVKPRTQTPHRRGRHDRHPRLLPRLLQWGMSLPHRRLCTTANVSRAESVTRKPARGSVCDGVGSRQRCILRIVDALHLPRGVSGVVFETLFFFTRVRVYLALIVVLVAVLVMTQSSVLDDVANTFIVMDEDRPGRTFLQRYHGGNRTLPHKHPIVIVPGFITNALEVWEGDLPCMREQALFLGSFRQRMLGPQMMYLSVRNTQCWLDLFSLDRDTGLDQPGVRVRADMGFASIDFVLPGFWVWAKVLVNFADIGYDPQSMAVITFDWRLSPSKMHERDGFFYSMRNTIKFLTQKNRERAIVLSHSYGTTIALAFLKWADEREPGFMDAYVAYYVNVGGAALGLPKSLSTMLLGDMRDTISIPRPMRTILDSFMNQTARYNTMRTWSAFVAMMPNGCDALHPRLLTLPNGTTLGARAARALMRHECQRTKHRDCVAELDRYAAAHTQLPSLPQAPNTTVVCLYGVNKPTEAGYVLEQPVADRLVTNVGYFDNNTVQGVRLTDGDGTVPLLSLGYMCRASNGWRQNVGRVVTVEYRHDSDTVPVLNLRGGSASGGHVDILGNYEFIETLLKLASGVDEVGGRQGNVTVYRDAAGDSHVVHRRVTDRIYSDIDERIEQELASCLAMTNEPIVPKATAESNPFVCRNDTRRRHIDER